MPEEEDHSRHHRQTQQTLKSNDNILLLLYVCFSACSLGSRDIVQYKKNPVVAQLIKYAELYHDFYF